MIETKSVEKKSSIDDDESKYIKDLKKSSSNLNEHTLNYISKYAAIAVNEMNSHKIPASITLAQGILESGNGRSELASKSNNHFGIKCHKNWRGERVYHDDDAKGECFRKYKYVENSFFDHSAFLIKRNRYDFLFSYPINDYKRWAKGLRKAGYATDKEYPNKLIRIIEKYQLFKFDKINNNDVSSKEIKRTKKVVKKAETDANSFVKNKVVKKDKKINQPKNTINNYKSDTHRVIKGDTLYSISRKNNISLDRLKKINNLKNNNIYVGQTLRIK
ncbi:glucosaminidase domain-containing protein [uncultured Polaribacter sp.]|uniref:glucosaminidase domain-containing protein n=1 Tax=uncultured Polaribacter sp. TaxID=174711 RepID=UPI00345D58D3